jgi:adenylate cyclase
VVPKENFCFVTSKYNSNNKGVVMQLFKKRTFKIDIVFVFTFLIIITVVIITSFVYFKNKAATLKLVNLNFKKEADAVLTKTENYMQNAQITTAIATKVFNKSALKLTLNSQESTYLLNTVKNQPPIELFYYGDVEGNFLQAGILGETIYTKQIKRIAGKAVTHLNYFDSKFKLKNSKSEADSKYDPRLRPWFKGAKRTRKIFWTEPYELKIAQLTAAIRHYQNQAENIFSYDVKVS